MASPGARRLTRQRSSRRVIDFDLRDKFREGQAVSSLDLAAQPVGAGIVAEALLEDDAAAETFEPLGRGKSSLSMFSSSSLAASRLQGGAPGAPAASGNGFFGLEEPGVLGDVVTLEEDTFVDDGPRPGSAERAVRRLAVDALVRPMASWVLTLNKFAVMRREAEPLECAGDARGAPRCEAHVAAVQQRVNLDLYSFEEQAQRWACAQHPAFRALARDLWRLAAGDAAGAELGQDAYVDVVVRVRAVCCPPSDASAAAASAERDWRSDSGDRGAVAYADFFRGVFQCVDVWTETTDAAEYVALLGRLLRGVTTRRRPRDELSFRKQGDVAFDAFFAVDAAFTAAPARAPSSLLRTHATTQLQRLARGGLARDDLARDAAARKKKAATPAPVCKDALFDIFDTFEFKTDDVTTKRRRSRASRSDLRSSPPRPASPALKPVPPAAKAPCAPRPRGGSGDVAKPSGVSEPAAAKPAAAERRDMLLTPAETNAMMARVYQALLQATQAAARNRGAGAATERSLRFDHFVARFFQMSHGTVGVARRHLRAFVRSVEAMAGGGAPAAARRPRHARARLFAEMAGLEGGPYNARLLPHYLLPVLRQLYPAVLAVADSLTAAPGSARARLCPRGADGAEGLPFADVVAALAAALPAGLRAAGDLVERTVEASRVGERHADVDAALWLALAIFKRVDALRAMRRRRCALLAQRHCRAALARWRAADADAKNSPSTPQRRFAEAKRIDASLNRLDAPADAQEHNCKGT
ncbi:hypothetical protein M885DRAFT_506218 [Pelagophyceae sp. CCMP2097]|nr:hypothetical protein M885DRAFT_506218 [Pelagophyceae sp. CCMP2097]